MSTLRNTAFFILALTFIVQGLGVNWVATIRGQVFELEPTDGGPAVITAIQAVLGAPIEQVRDLGNSLLVWLTDSWTNVPGLALSLTQLLDMRGSFCRLITDNRAYCEAASPFSDRMAVRADALSPQLPNMTLLARQGSECISNAGTCQPGADQCSFCLSSCRSVSAFDTDCGFAFAAWRNAVACVTNIWINHINTAGTELNAWAAEEQCESPELDAAISRKR